MFSLGQNEQFIDGKCGKGGICKSSMGILFLCTWPSSKMANSCRTESRRTISLIVSDVVGCETLINLWPIRTLEIITTDTHTELKHWQALLYRHSPAKIQNAICLYYRYFLDIFLFKFLKETLFCAIGQRTTRNSLRVFLFILNNHLIAIHCLSFGTKTFLHRRPSFFANIMNKLEMSSAKLSLIKID